MIEPSNQDFGDTPDSVREYVYGLEKRIAKLEEENRRLILARNQKGEELGKLRREIYRLHEVHYNTGRSDIL